MREMKIERQPGDSDRSAEGKPQERGTARGNGLDRGGGGSQCPEQVVRPLKEQRDTTKDDIPHDAATRRGDDAHYGEAEDIEPAADPNFDARKCERDDSGAIEDTHDFGGGK